MKAAKGKILSRSEALEHLHAIGWKEVQAAGGPVPIAEWAAHGFEGEKLYFYAENYAVETCGREDCDHCHAEWRFGNF